MKDALRIALAMLLTLLAALGISSGVDVLLVAAGVKPEIVIAVSSCAGFYVAMEGIDPITDYVKENT